MIEPKKGLQLIGRSTGLRAKVTNVTKSTITVEVERKVRQRNGESRTETRIREITPDTWQFFVLGYDHEQSS